MNRFLFVILLFCCLMGQNLNAQMWSEMLGDTLYGNEWINFDHPDRYYKIKVGEDGIYRINYETLLNANIPVSDISAEQYQLFRMGEETPIYISASDEPLNTGDYIEFYGQKNRSELDRYLFKNPDEEMLNPEYSLITDTMTYFLTWTEVGEGLRFEEVENDLGGELPAVEEWFEDEVLLNYTARHFKSYQKISGLDIYYSHFDVAEGYATVRSVNRTENISPSAVHPSSTQASLSIRLATNVGAHLLEIDVDEVNYVVDSFESVQLKAYNFDVPLSTNNSDLSVAINGLASTSDQHVLSNIKLKYRRAYNFGNQSSFYFELPESNNSKYLEIENFSAAGQNPILYDLNNHIRLTTFNENGVIKILVPPTNRPRHLLLYNPSMAFQEVENLQQRAFTNYQNQEAEFIILTHPFFYDDGQGNNWVQEYADYRISPTGGSYTTAIVDVEELYDQFAYGVFGHPLSVRNFSHRIKKDWETAKYFFLIGKGREMISVRTNGQFEGAYGETFFVPTFGWPGADNLLFSNNHSAVPILPIGRLSARNGQEVKIYLDKVKAYEANKDNPQTLEDRGWMKHIVHLGGGGSAGEQALIRGHLEGMADVISNNQFGGKVSGFYKTSTDPVQVSISEQIFDRINKGVSIITFFGHSSSGTFDFDIDNPDSYDNLGKTPLLFALGCSAGNYFTNSNNISERFTFLENKGTIAFAASRGFGFVSSLQQFMRKYYELAGGEQYSQGVGDILKATYQARSQSTFIGDVTLLQQFSFQADPALRLHPSPGPDYVIDKNSVSFEPNVVNLSQDSFKISFDVVNVGQHLLDSMTVEITQQLPNGEQVVAKKDRVATPSHTLELAYTLPTLGKASVGLNQFFITVDKDDDIEELPAPDAELNNELLSTIGTSGVSLFIVDNSAIPVYPNNFGIVGEQGVILKASTADALAPERKYLVELDTIALFNSPLKQSTTIVQKGGLIKWQPNMTYENERVYYWRISPDSTDAQIGYLWETSSFTFVEGSEGGWSQGHYWQFLENEFEKMQLNEETQAFEFGDKINDIRIKNKVYTSDDPPSFIFNGQPFASPWPWVIHEGIQIIIIDPITGRWFIPQEANQYGSVSNVNHDPWIFKTDTPENRAAMMSFIENNIPDDYYVLLWTVQRTIESDFYPEEWAADSQEFGKNLFDVLEQVGANQVRLLEERGAVPYVLLFQKNGAVLNEGIANNINETINVEFPFTQKWQDGSIRSRVIGPAVQWHELHTNFDFTQLSVGDSLGVIIKGLNEPNTEGLDLLTLTPSTSTTIDLSSINAQKFPYLQLRYFAVDEIERKPVSMDYWRVFYKGIPEVAINTNEQFVFHADTLEQGDLFKMSYSIQNVSDYNIDSLLIKYTLKDKNGEQEVIRKRIAPIMSLEKLYTEFSYETKTKSNEYQLIVEINPDKDQIEQYHFNNFILTDFLIEKDKRNPLIDVTFDGRHIMNGEIVSPNTEIFIRITDENTYLPLSDTSFFTLYLKSPNEVNTKVIPFDGNQLQFFPATANGINEASMIFRPLLEKDGIYELRLRVTDASDNSVGERDYRTLFEIINKEMISNVFNYPNPFSTSTKFVYTLTGNELPDVFKIQILTVSGKVVKEISQPEIGELKIGRHTTDYSWDGTDEFGDKLANGVYLYRVITQKADGTAYEKYDTGTDSFFKGEFGKLVILR